MAKITFHDNPVNTVGDLPATGTVAADFSLVKGDLSELSLSDLKGKNVILNIFPSIDTGVCATSVRKFNKEASSLNNTIVLCISADLPFASGRFCGAEGLKDVVTLSAFRDNNAFANACALAGPNECPLARFEGATGADVVNYISSAIEASIPIPFSCPNSH